ncbi:MAG: MFS transporter [Solobacterium sp.]|nr:MFS transporter [Solobacterium sp.]
MSKKESVRQPLWTRDFTIITAGSAVSMFGNAMSGFAMSLLVLDMTGSTLLYAVYMILYTLPQIIMPVVSGALLDRFSRKKTIWCLDFISAFLYMSAALILHGGFFSFPVFALYVFLIGAVNSTYMVAFDSFYPLLITEGNYSRAYSLMSVLETASAVMVPVSAWAYNQFGISPMMAVNAVSFLIAACLEMQIRTEEKYIAKQRSVITEGKRTFSDIREGAAYLMTRPGLKAIAFYFAFASLAGGASQVVTLPYFKSTYPNGEYIYMIVWGMAVAGRGIGGLIHYHITLPVQKKFTIAFVVYMATSLIEAFYLFLPVPVMAFLLLCTGFMGITSYTIRTSSTQSYVPDEMKGRFNGACNMLNTAGALAGEMTAGILADIISGRIVLMAFMLINALAAVILIGKNKKDIAPIYNTQN